MITRHVRSIVYISRWSELALFLTIVSLQLHPIFPAFDNDDGHSEVSHQVEDEDGSEDAFTTDEDSYLPDEYFQSDDDFDGSCARDPVRILYPRGVASFVTVC